jgi:hypothetical protein
MHSLIPRVALMFLLSLGAFGCAATSVSSILSSSYRSPDLCKSDRSRYEVTVFTTDRARGERFLDRLRTLGYNHPGNEVLDDPNDNNNIKWGGAPFELIAELLSEVKREYNRDLRLSQEFEWADTDVFINLPLGAGGTGFEGNSEGGPDFGVPGGVPGEGLGDSPPGPEALAACQDGDRSGFRIVVFTWDEDMAQALLARLAEAGFDNPANSYQDMPNENFNIKWGCATEAVIEEIATIVGASVSQPLDRMQVFAADDADIFINLPQARQ